MDPITIINLIVVIAMSAERIYRRFERYLETRTPIPTAHLEMPPPQQRPPPTPIVIPPRTAVHDLKRE